MERIRREHPVQVTDDGAVRVWEGADGDALWRRVEQASEKARGAVITALRRTDRLIMLHFSQSWRNAPCYREVVRELSRSVDQRWLLLAAELHVMTDGSAGFASMAARFDSLSNIPDCLRDVVSSSHPISRLISRYLAQHGPMRDLISENAPPPWQSLYGTLMSTVVNSLRISTSHLVTRESADRVPEIVFDALKGDTTAWYRRYLSDVSIGQPAARDPILTAIVGQFSPPFEEKAFWQGVANDKRDWVQQWVIGGQLESFLDGTRRVVFWKRFLPHILGVERTRDKAVVAIHFSGFAALQFVEPGTSTRFVRRSVAARIQSLDQNDIKHRLYHAIDLGRYHQRGDSWEIAAAQTVRDVMKQHGTP